MSSPYRWSLERGQIFCFVISKWHILMNSEVLKLIIRVFIVSSLSEVRVDSVANFGFSSKAKKTRKPCYRKDDRAMRPICGCPEKFRESSQTPPATFPENCKELLFRSILRMCIQNLKFVALSVPEIIGGTQKIWAVPRYAYAPFSLKFLKGFCSDGPCEYTCQI